jgi:hypothetical protein
MIVAAASEMQDEPPMAGHFGACGADAAEERLHPPVILR